MINYCGDNVMLNNAELVMNQDGFINSLHEMILNTKDFTHTNATSEHIAHAVYNIMKHGKICVKVYYPKWRWSSAIGYFSADKPNQININGYKLKNMKIEDVVSNWSHEICHLADNNDDLFSWGHGNNRYNESKKMTVPYVAGRYARQLVLEAKNK